METKQLSYFLMACQCQSHAEAAGRVGISASTLSENLSHLEQELGMTLFRRGVAGHCPTPVARWLYQNVEPILQLTEAAESSKQWDWAGRHRRLRITSPLYFALGHISRSASLAARELRDIHPDTLTELRFDRDPSPDEEPACNFPGVVNDEQSLQKTVEEVLIDYSDLDGTRRQTLLFNDDWVGITNMKGRLAPAAEMDFATLSRFSIILPQLPPGQVRKAQDYCARHGLPTPSIVADDLGSFPRLANEAHDFVMLAPFSLVRNGLSQVNLNQFRLPAPMSSPVVARVASGGRAARDYVELLGRTITDDDPHILYSPKITLRQMRYFLVLLDHLNMSVAARKLHVVQPALSSQLRKLEAAVGRSLFHRRRSGLEPMPEAIRLGRLVEKAVAHSNRVAFEARHVAAARRRHLSIGLVPLINHTGALVDAVSGAVDEWMTAFPDVELKVVEAPAVKLHRLVEAGEINFGLVEAHVSRSSQLDLHSHDQLGVISRAGGHELLGRGNVAFRRLTELPLVLPSADFGLRQLLDKAADEAALHLAPRLEVNSLTMILALVRRTPLATVMPAAAIQPFVSEGAFQFNPIVEPVILRRLSIIFSTSRNLTEIERALVGILRQHLSAVGFNAVAAEKLEASNARPTV